MSVIDTSAIVDYLLDWGVERDVERMMLAEGELVAPDVLVFETLAVLRRALFRGLLDERRATGAMTDLGDLALDLVPTLELRTRAWELRDNMAAADALFVALAERLGEPLATKDRALAAAAAAHTDVDVRLLGG